MSKKNSSPIDRRTLLTRAMAAGVAGAAAAAAGVTPADAQAQQAASGARQAARPLATSRSRSAASTPPCRCARTRST